MKISHSDVDAHNLCKRKTYYGVGQRLQKRNRSLSLNRGILVHEIMQEFYSRFKETQIVAASKQAADTAMQKAMLTYDGEIVADAARIMSYFYQKPGFLDSEIVAVEKRYQLQVDEETIYPFTVDLIIKDAFGRLAVVDHKTTYDFYSERAHKILPQIPKYSGALRVLGIPIEYGIYHQLRYRKLKSTNRDDYIRETEFTPTLKRIQTVFLEQMHSAKEIEAFLALPPEEQDRAAVRTANTMVCNSCPFFDLCTSDLNGFDTELIKQTEFTEREERYADLENEYTD